MVRLLESKVTPEDIPEHLNIKFNNFTMTVLSLFFLPLLYVSSKSPVNDFAEALPDKAKNKSCCFLPPFLVFLLPLEDLDLDLEEDVFFFFGRLFFTFATFATAAAAVVIVTNDAAIGRTGSERRRGRRRCIFGSSTVWTRTISF